MTIRFLLDHVSRAALRAHGDAIELLPGVALGLARLAGLLKPALEIMWVDDVRRMNNFLDAEVPRCRRAPVRPRARCVGRASRAVQGALRAALLLLQRHLPGEQPD